MSEALAGVRPLVKAVAKDQKAELLEAVGPLDGISILATQVLVAVYIRPEVTKGGILRPSHVGARREDAYQGTLGLIIQLGATAFSEDAQHRWEGVVPKLHDWVLFNVGDAMGLQIRGQRCRIIEDVNLKMVVPSPDVITDWIVERPGYSVG